MGAGEQHSGRQLEDLARGLLKLGDAAFACAIELGGAADLAILGAVAGFALVEAIAQPVRRFPGHEIRRDIDIIRIGVADPKAIILLDRPAVARLAPLIGHCAARRGDPGIGGGSPKAHRVERAVRHDLGRASRAGEHPRERYAGEGDCPRADPKQAVSHHPAPSRAELRAIYAVKPAGPQAWAHATARAQSSCMNDARPLPWRNGTERPFPSAILVLPVHDGGLGSHFRVFSEAAPREAAFVFLMA